MIAIRDYDVAVIGAGPARLFCALHAAATGRRVVLFDKNEEAGRKLLLAGSGQCNISHEGEIREFIAHYGSHGRFVKPALLSFTNRQLGEFFRERGLQMMTEEGGKIFPETRKSADVLAVLLAECAKKGVTLRCREPVRQFPGRRAVHGHDRCRAVPIRSRCHHYGRGLVPEIRDYR